MPHTHKNYVQKIYTKTASCCCCGWAGGQGQLVVVHFQPHAVVNLVVFEGDVVLHAGKKKKVHEGIDVICSQSDTLGQVMKNGGEGGGA